MKVDFTKFSGIIPKKDPMMLPFENSVIAENCEFDNLLNSINDDIDIDIGIDTDKNTKKIIYYKRNDKNFYYAFDYLPDVVNEFLSIKEKYFYYVGKDKKLYTHSKDGINYLAGIPKPDVTIKANADINHEKKKDSEMVAYRISIVDGFRNEGSLSDPSNIISLSEEVLLSGKKNTISIEVKLNSIPDGYNLKKGKIKVRLYRSNTGTKKTIWQYVDEFDVSGLKLTTYIDRKNSFELEEKAVTENWLPPKENIKHLISDSKGHTVIAYENTVAISAPNVPSAYPKNQQYYIPERLIVGLAVGSMGIYVLTNLGLYLLTGEKAEALSAILLIPNISCMSKQSIITIEDKLFFATDEGLSVVEKGKNVNITKDVFTHKQWRDLNPKTMHGFKYKNNYILKTDFGMLEFNLSKKIDISTIEKKYKYITKSIDETTYLALNDKGKPCIFRYADSHIIAKWKSKLFVLNIPVSITCVRILAKNYPVLINIYDDNNVKIYTKQICSELVYKINVPKKLKKWQYEVVFKGLLFEVSFASSITEMKKRKSSK